MVAAPQVVAHRLARLATAGHNPSARDRREFQRMGAEKVSAFWESWQAMAMQQWRLQQAACWTAARAWGAMWWGVRPVAAAPFSLAKMQADALSVMAQGLSPVRRRAVANARRLAALRSTR